MPGRRSSTKPSPAQGFSITAATTATRAAGETSRPPSAQISSTMVTILRTLMSAGSQALGGDDGVGGAVPDAGVRAGTGGSGGDDDHLVRPGGVGDACGDGLVVAAGGRPRLVPHGDHQRLACLGARIGEADDRLATEEVAHQVAEVRRVDERPSVLD